MDFLSFSPFCCATSLSPSSLAPHPHSPLGPAAPQAAVALGRPQNELWKETGHTAAVFLMAEVILKPLNEHLESELHGKFIPIQHWGE